MSIINKEQLILALGEQFTKEVLPYLKDKTANAFDEFINDLFNSNYTSISQPYPDSMWISNLDGTKLLTNGIVTCAYLHPTEEHAAISIGSLGRKVSRAYAGKWAVSIQTKSRKGNKTGYETFENEGEAIKRKSINNHTGKYTKYFNFNGKDFAIRKVINGYYLNDFLDN